MSNSKHTPGPWAVMNSHEFVSGGIVKPEYLIDHGYVSVDVANANARLIAAAPELLSKLAEFINVLDKGIERTDVDLDATLVEARKLMAKVTGGGK